MEWFRALQGEGCHKGKALRKGCSCNSYFHRAATSLNQKLVFLKKALLKEVSFYRGRQQTSAKSINLKRNYEEHNVLTKGATLRRRDLSIVLNKALPLTAAIFILKKAPCIKESSSDRGCAKTFTKGLRRIQIDVFRSQICVCFFRNINSRFKFLEKLSPSQQSWIQSDRLNQTRFLLFKCVLLEWKLKI